MARVKGREDDSGHEGVMIEEERKVNAVAPAFLDPPQRGNGAPRLASEKTEKIQLYERFNEPQI